MFNASFLCNSQLCPHSQLDCCPSSCPSTAPGNQGVGPSTASFPHVGQARCNLWSLAGYSSSLISCLGKRSKHKSEDAPSHRSPAPWTPRGKALPRSSPAARRAGLGLLSTLVLELQHFTLLLNQFPTCDLLGRVSCYVYLHLLRALVSCPFLFAAWIG